MQVATASLPHSRLSLLLDPRIWHPHCFGAVTEIGVIATVRCTANADTAVQLYRDESLQPYLGYIYK